ncbi:Lrp/AsnC family transcriptional regulator [Actinotalea sp. Marseille-Q4924]|uniref:Lrp/AsnC family transcriptional regulator n=1 Tax=Actinotalea sp. Marseille-Q4924 TaxID=2866571 RepID=UPI001CE3EC4D|nr:Lrp/AsnC family transcriptional regulator [Actinotalea sp. Marseille-Q4924]
MDDVDRAILRELSADARLPYRDLGTRVGLSPNAAAARVRRLVESGVIARFTVELGPGAGGEDGRGAPRGTGMEVFIDVRLKEGVTCDDFAQTHRAFAEVVDAAHVTGPYDYLVHAVVRDAAGLDRLVRRLKTEAGVAQTSTRLAIRTPPRR